MIETTLGIVRNPLPGQHIVHTEAEFSVQQGRDQVKRIVEAAEKRAQLIADAVYAQSYSVIAAAHARANHITEMGELPVDMDKEMEDLDLVKDPITYECK